MNINNRAGFGRNINDLLNDDLSSRETSPQPPAGNRSLSPVPHGSRAHRNTPPQANNAALRHPAIATLLTNRSQTGHVTSLDHAILTEEEMRPYRDLETTYSDLFATQEISCLEKPDTHFSNVKDVDYGEAAVISRP